MNTDTLFRLGIYTAKFANLNNDTECCLTSTDSSNYILKVLKKIVPCIQPDNKYNLVSNLLIICIKKEVYHSKYYGIGRYDKLVEFKIDQALGNLSVLATTINIEYNEYDDDYDKNNTNILKARFYDSLKRDYIEFTNILWLNRENNILYSLSRN